MRAPAKSPPFSRAPVSPALFGGAQKKLKAPQLKAACEERKIVSRAIIAGIWVAFFQRVPAIIVRTGDHGERGEEAGVDDQEAQRLQGLSTCGGRGADGRWQMCVALTRPSIVAEHWRRQERDPASQIIRSEKLQNILAISSTRYLIQNSEPPDPGPR